MARDYELDYLAGALRQSGTSFTIVRAGGETVEAFGFLERVTDFAEDGKKLREDVSFIIRTDAEAALSDDGVTDRIIIGQATVGTDAYLYPDGCRVLLPDGCALLQETGGSVTSGGDEYVVHARTRDVGGLWTYHLKEAA